MFLHTSTMRPFESAVLQTLQRNDREPRQARLAGVGGGAGERAEQWRIGQPGADDQHGVRPQQPAQHLGRQPVGTCVVDFAERHEGGLRAGVLRNVAVQVEQLARGGGTIGVRGELVLHRLAADQVLREIERQRFEDRPAGLLVRGLQPGDVPLEEIVVVRGDDMDVTLLTVELGH